ncbi:hypothetical protein IZU99_04110 [Oscillospiraceae bacterium CM]|nr:hypothetical protein IZU99_04110 [Oscillospiraceae bacterium CM]
MDLLGFGKKKKITDIWPKDDKGEMIAPAFLMHAGGSPVDTEVTLSLLEAYGIPAICQYPNNGEFGKLIIGHAAGGVDIFVPETLLEDAQNILSADVVDENDVTDKNDNDKDA